jgi:hypothetical protein
MEKPVVDGYTFCDTVARMEECVMLGLIAALLLVWLAFILFGIFIKGLVWLLVIGIVLFVATSLSAFVKHKTSS